jgi:ATP-binding cassette subfamily C protein LapB
MFSNLKVLAGKLALPAKVMRELLLASLLVSFLGLVSSLYSMQVMNRYVTFGIDATLFTLTVGALIALLLEWLLRKARGSIELVVCSRAVRRAQEQALVAYASARYQLLEQIPVTQRREMLTGLQSIAQAYSPQNLSGVMDAPFAVLYLVAIYLLSPTLAGVVLLIVAVIWLLAGHTQRQMRAPTEGMNDAASRVGGVSHFLASAGETLRMFNCVPQLRRDWSEANAQQGELRNRLHELQVEQQHHTIIGTNLMTIVVYAAGAVHVVLGRLDIGSLIAVSILATRALSTFARLTQSQELFERAVQAYRRLDAVGKIPAERQEGHVPRELAGRLELIDIALTWPGQPMPLFESLSLTLPAGGVMAVVGGNAAGKSSLLRVLVGLLEPDRGHVKYDGQDLRQFVPEWWRQRLVYLPQEPQFFDGTLRENLKVMRHDVDDETLLGWCRKLDLAAFLDSQPRGLDTPVRNAGSHLPVGVRRRLALVRAILTEGRVAVLDEPFEGVDTRGAQAITMVLNELVSRGCTVVMATREEFVIKSANIVLDLSSKPVPQVIDRALRPQAGD